MFLLALFACGDQQLHARHGEYVLGEPRIVVEPDRVVLGPVPEGCPTSGTITVMNVGEGPLDVSRAWLDGSGPLSVQQVDTSLPPGGSTTVELRFASASAWEGAADLVIDSDDPLDPRVRVPVLAYAVTGEPRTDVWYHVPDPIDILWVVDNSDSLWEERARLANDINAFFEWFLPYGVDFHVGVVTTDVTNPDVAGVLQGEPTFLTRDTPAVEAAFAAAIDVGHEEWGNEAGLYAMELALTEPNRSGPNAGFLRDDARLTVVFVSDEPDQSGYNSRRFVELLTELKGDPERVLPAAIVGDRVLGCESTCDGHEQTARPGDTYHEVVEAFGGVSGSICTCEVAPFLQELGLQATDYMRAFPLSEKPRDPSVVVVYVDGERVTTGWTWDAARNAVVFDLPPASGSVVQVTYEVAMACPS